MQGEKISDTGRQIAVRDEADSPQNILAIRIMGFGLYASPKRRFAAPIRRLPLCVSFLVRFCHKFANILFWFLVSLVMFFWWKWPDHFHGAHIPWQSLEPHPRISAEGTPIRPSCLMRPSAGRHQERKDYEH